MTTKKDIEIAHPEMSRPQFYRSHPLQEDDEIVISGMSGRFPNAPNVAEFANGLYNKVNLLQDTAIRWKHTDPDIPRQAGWVHGINKFDATFFGVHHIQAHAMDPQCRLVLEEAYMSVMDAGINPNSLRGSRTGVYVASCFSESEKNIVNDPNANSSFTITGCSRAMYANRISYTLGTIGPSLYVDTACSSSMYAIDVAYAALRSGEIDAAIVGGTNLILFPNATLHFSRLGVLSQNGVCSPFDQKANGYVRSEGVAALFLQRRRDAHRIYATLVHSKTNCDGYKTEGITYPSGVVQEQLLKEFYQEVNISADDIGYMEAHSTGTKVGDPEECRAIDNAICKQRSETLLVGSAKSNIGHTEPTSGICSVVKVVHTFQTGKIPPNINFSKPRDGIAALEEGRMKVVSEIMDLKKPYVGVNSFGFGGANAHILLKQHDKKKSGTGVSEGSLPRLCLWSGRTKESVEKVFSKLECKPLDPEFIALLHSVQAGGIPGMVFRGYNVLDSRGAQAPHCFGKDVQHYTGVKRPIVWVFSGMGSQWTGMGTALMAVPQFRMSIQRCYNALKPAGVDLVKVLTSDDPTTFDNIMHSLIGIAAIQIALVDVLRMFGMNPDYIIGHSTGELGCAYADGCFTLEQTMLAAYYRGKVSMEKDKIKGAMAAIGLSYNEIRGILPEPIEVACHNGPDSCTISGPVDDVKQFIEQLKSQNIFAREVPCSNIPYHTRYIAHLGGDFLKYLKHIVPHPKKRSAKWLSTSVPHERWSHPEAQVSSAEYHTNNLLSSVLFEETTALLPENALTVEISPHGLLQSILKTSMTEAVHIALTQRNNKNNQMFFLAALGKLYLNGLDVPVSLLYPRVDWPVSCGTDTISDLIEWDHRDEWEVPGFDKIRSGEKTFQIHMKNDDCRFLEGHNIDGKVLVPATYYLECVWKTFGYMHNHHNHTELSIEMENVKFVRATTLTMDTKLNLTVMIHLATGNFEVIDNDSLVVSGTIREIRDSKNPSEIPIQPFDTTYGEEYRMSTRDFYKELKLRGYYYGGAFKSVEWVRGDGQLARIKWDSNWVSFMDCLLQTQIVKKDSRELCLPTKIEKIRIFGRYHLATVGNQKHIDIYTSDLEGRVLAGGIEIIGMKTNSVQRRKPPGLPVLERYQFVSHFPSPALRVEDIGRFVIQLILENDPFLKVKILELMPKSERTPIIEYFFNAVEDLPLITGEYTVLSSRKYEDLPSDVTILDDTVAAGKGWQLVIDQTGGDALKLTDDLADRSYLVIVLNAEENMSTPAGYSVCAVCPWVEAGLKCVVLRKYANAIANEVKFLKVSSRDTEFKWLKLAQTKLESNDLIIIAENDQFSGVLGLTNCLRKECIKKSVRCILIDDPKAPAFDPKIPFYADHLALGLAVNIYRKGHWGTYRHLQLLKKCPVEPYSGHAYGNIIHRGDLSTLKWFRGPHNPTKSQFKVIYSSINFKDIMLATGRISADIFGSGRLMQEIILGFEYSGVDEKTGKRVMGVMEKAAVTSHIYKATDLTLSVPDSWSLREAATVPVVYLTVYYSFFLRTDIRRGKSILIHAGTGGIGLAAIRTALAYGLEVFTTVSTAEKKSFLLKTFPQLKENHIGNSRDTSFEGMIKTQTNGMGVDFVLNSLAEEKLIASVKCLGRGGVFLEIGKFDMANDNPLGMEPFLKEISFVAVLMDLLICGEKDIECKKLLCQLVERDIANGIVQPLPSTVFQANDIEQAFRYLASAKHIGKVLIQVSESAESKVTLPMEVMPAVYFSPDKVYVVLGGLGGFGLELIDWMVLRGARKIVVSSSRGISNGYQSYRIQMWKSYGCDVQISTANITTKYGCDALLRGAFTLGPVGGIFNLAVVLKDEVFENQNEQFFKESLAPKALATKYLDELSRQVCPSLEHFVVFSSVSCGRGNVGQTNYGMANSIMERIIEARVANGLPGKAIEWGAVGEVGLVAVLAEDKIDFEIGGTLQQRISSCLQELDTLLSCPDPIVASMVVAEKRLGKVGSESILETVMNIMSIRDAKSVSYNATLSDLGMDSLTAVDIKQTLERDFDLFLSPQDLRSLTLQKLQELSQGRGSKGKEVGKANLQELREQVTVMVRNLGDEENYENIVVPLNKGHKGNPPVFFFSGIEGTSGPAWQELGKNIAAPSFIIQLHKTKGMGSFDDIADFALKQITAMLKPKENFRLVAYSFGSIIVTKVVHLLENLGHVGKIFIIDGSPSLIYSIHKTYSDAVGRESFDAMVLTKIVTMVVPEESEESIQSHFQSISSHDEKIQAMQKYVRRQKFFSEDYVSAVAIGILQRIHLIFDMDMSSFKRINAPICLVKPVSQIVANISNDYDLSLVTNNEITVHVLEGNHSTILENRKLSQLINEFLLSGKP